ncbi:MAG: hypothetical protein QOJ16_2070, partial [Acidobacteriota bacterium]|nr:hypothetical protein [Acidobacteriota bacterium]
MPSRPARNLSLPGRAAVAFATAVLAVLVFTPAARGAVTAVQAGGTGAAEMAFSPAVVTIQAGDSVR